MNELPAELRFKPTPLVAITGASLELYQMLEKAVSVVTIEAQRSGPIFRFLYSAPKDIVIPPRNDKDRPVDYTPEGILPTGWFNAVIKRIPSALVHIVEWDAPDFKSKEYEHCNSIDILRSIARARNIPVLLFIVKKDAFVSNDEKITAFKRKTQLDMRYIYHFVRDDFQASMTNFENTIKKCSSEFYLDETKHAKKRKEKLSKVHHLKLMVRASYKMGFFSELCNDFVSALKHYAASYTQLRDVKKNWKDFDEIKVVAEVLNFRLCYLHLERNSPSNATTQFHQHVNYYRSLIGDPDREYQHYAWVSRQFLIFGELLQLFASMAPLPTPNQGPTVVPSSLSSNRSRGLNHPGFYFQAAANYESQRRSAAAKLCTPNRSKETVQKYLASVKPYRASVMDFQKNTYVGQKVESSVLDVPKFSSESSTTMTTIMEAVLNNSTDIAIAQELLVNHSQLIVQLLVIAQDVYRLDHTPNDRTIWHLMSQVAQESFLVGDFATTKANNDVVVPHYRREKWWGLLAICQKMNFQCSIHMKHWYEALLTAADLLSPSFPTSLEDRKYYLSAISNIIHAHRSEAVGPIEISASNPLQSSTDRLSTGNLSSSSASLTASGSIVGEQAKGTARPSTPPFSGILASSSHSDVPLSEPVILLQNNPATSLVKCHVSFPQQSASIHDKVDLQVTLTSYFPTAVRFDSLSISFTDSNLNTLLKDGSHAYLEQHLAKQDLSAEFLQQIMMISPKQLADLAALPNSLVLLPQKPKTLTITLAFTHISKIQCAGATLTWGTHPRCLTLKWDWTHLQKHSMTQGSSGTAQTPAYHPHSHVWDSSQRRLLEQTSIDVLQLTPKLDLVLEHAPEALEGEKMPIKISIRNGEDRINQGFIRISHLGTPSTSSSSNTANNTETKSPPGSGKVPNLKLAVPPASTGTLAAGSGSKSLQCPFISEKGETDADVHEIKVGTISANSSLDTVVYFVAPRRQRGEEYTFKVRFIYDTDTYSTTAEHTLRLPIRAPFDVSFDVYDQEFREVPIVQYSAHRIVVGSTFYVRAELSSVFDLTLNGIELLPVHGETTYQNLTQEANKFAEPTTLHKGDKYSIWFVLKSTAAMNHSLGTFSVQWKRAAPLCHNNAEDAPIDTFAIASAASWHGPAPAIYAESAPFQTTFKCNHSGIIGKPLSHETHITNNTGSVLCLALEVEENLGGFVVSGDKRAQYRLNAFASLTIMHTFVPLSVGTQKCPKFHIKQLTSDGAGLGPGGIMEQPFLTLAHADIFVEPNQQGPLIV
jgi:hypothetical protein